MRAPMRFAAVLAALPLAAGISLAAAPELMPRTPVIERPWPADSPKWSFAIIADRWSGGEGNWPIYDRAVAEINLLRPDFAITIGDMISGHVAARAEWDAEWAEYREHAAVLRMPLFFTPGNHDISSPEMQAFWEDDLGRSYYSFDYRGCHFLVLNTEQDKTGGREGAWADQMRFALTDLARSRGARHTFVFMHKPMWRDPRYETEWARIDSALGLRKYSAFAGHTHTLEFDDTRDNRHLVLGVTGGGTRVNSVKELGHFHHFARVVVEGDSVAVAIIEPGGPMHSDRVARRTWQEAAHGIVRVDGRAVRVSGSVAEAAATVTFRNDLPDTVRAVAYGRNLAGSGWRHAAGSIDTLRVALPPGASVQKTWNFDVRADRLTSPPYFQYDATRGADTLAIGGGRIPLYPAAALRTIPEWRVAGPIDVSPISPQLLPADPRRAMPRLYERPAPLDDPAAGTWKIGRPDSDGELDFNALVGTKDHALAYATCAVWSPDARVTHAAIAADNYAEVILNGERVPNGGVYGRPGETLWAPIALKPGWNTLAVRLVNNRGDWWLDVRIADAAGDLRFAPRPE